ncbi:hypothetical protein V6N12_037464 [Hibiscus sabdariffa]|uniref:Uncharacterized protein n=1 Tax=Hibiscus sabdariffa TaxID=183260 RepID=A0ABR2AU06_9ROSI
MALVIYWYDFICFGIVAAAFVGSLWVLWKKEAASRCDEESVYESLLAARPDADGLVRATPRAHVGLSQLWTSCWIRVHPVWLVVTRFFSFAVLAGFLSWDIVEWDASIFVYYTEWTFTLVMVYFASHYAQEEFQRRAGFWGYLMQTIYQTCGGAVILTDLVFWLVIVPFLSNSHLGLNMLMGCMHTVNAVLLILDTLLNSLPFPLFRFAYFVLWSCVYVVFQWVIHACGFTWWPYPFLELNTPWAPLWYFVLALVHIPCYGIYALIVKAKNSIFPRLFPHDFVRSY